MSTVRIAVSSDGDPEFGTKVANLLKLQQLLAEAACLLRVKFKERWAKHAGSKWDDDRSGNTEMFVNGYGQKVFEKFRRIQKGHIQSGNVDSWDITTLTDILIHVHFNEDQYQNNNQEKRNLEQLKQIRNQVAHNPQAGISNEQMEELWAKAEPLILYFGGKVENMQKIKNATKVSDFESQNVPSVHEESSKLATRLKDEGNQFFKNKMFVKAVESYTTAIALDGLSPMDRGIFYCNRSASYLRLSEQNKGNDSDNMYPEQANRLALDDAKEVIKLRPAWYKGYYRAGNAYHRERKYKKAIMSFDWALSLAPGVLEIQHARDESRRKLGIDTRKEHMQPNQLQTLHNTPEDTRKIVEETLGVPVSLEMLQKSKEFNEQRIPGQADVYRAHDYREGTPEVIQNEEMAVRYYTKAASVGNAEGIYNLSQLYTKGKGVKQDFGMAIKLLKEAASKEAFRNGFAREPVVGVAEAEHALGLNYEEGVGVQQNFLEAHKWYEKASDHGSACSPNNLACLYHDGKGVPQNMKRAGQYWHLAASRKNCLAMASLAIYYATIEFDSIQAQHWHKLAIEHGNLDAKLHKTEFDAMIDKLESEKKKMEKGVTGWELSQGLEAAGELKLADRLERCRKNMLPPEITAVLDDLRRVTEAGNVKSKTPENEEGLPYDADTLQEYAERGSTTARQILLAKKHFHAAMEIYTSIGLNSDTLPRFCKHLADCCRIEHTAIQLTKKMKSEWIEIVHGYLKTFPTNDEVSDLEKDARVCYVVLNGSNLTSSPRFAEASKKKYPKERVFHEMSVCLLAFLSNYKSAMDIVREALTEFPNDVELAHHQAEISYLMLQEAAFYGSYVSLREELTAKSCITKFEHFLMAAPKDHLMVPSAYYAIGVLSGLELDETSEHKASSSNEFLLNTMHKYYMIGLEAEKIQLPYYLPYVCSHKPVLENVLRVHSLMPGIPRSSLLKVLALELSIPDTKHSNSPDMTILTNPHRVAVIKEHRQFVQDRRKQENIGRLTTWTPKHKQRAPKQKTGLKSITFKDMNMFQDKVYENCVLTVTSLEDPPNARWPSIMLALEDEHHQACRAFIYNFKVRDYEQMVKQLGHGAKLSINNPYMRLGTLDGGYGIRVDDIRSLILLTESEPTACRFCGAKDAKKTCGKCGKAFYCGRECQEADWKIMKHKLICFN